MMKTTQRGRLTALVQRGVLSPEEAKSLLSENQSIDFMMSVIRESERIRPPTWRWRASSLVVGFDLPCRRVAVM